MPNRSTILCARSGWDVPLKTFIFGILLCNITLGFSRFARNKLLARTCWDNTGITENRPMRTFVYATRIRVGEKKRPQNWLVDAFNQFCLINLFLNCDKNLSNIIKIGWTRRLILKNGFKFHFILFYLVILIIALEGVGSEKLEFKLFFIGVRFMLANMRETDRVSSEQHFATYFRDNFIIVNYKVWKSVSKIHNNRFFFLSIKLIVRELEIHKNPFTRAQIFKLLWYYRWSREVISIMANIAAQRIKREFKEVIKSEEVSDSAEKFAELSYIKLPQSY